MHRIKSAFSAVILTTTLIISSVHASETFSCPDHTGLGLDTVVSYHDYTLYDNLLVDVPGGGGFYAQEIAIYNAGAYTITNLTLKTTCIDIIALTQQQEDLADLIQNRPDPFDLQANAIWQQEMQAIQTRQINSVTDSVKKGNNLLVGSVALFTSFTELNEFRKVSDYSCRSNIKIDVLWGETQSFDIDKSTYLVKTKGTSQNVSISQYNKASCD